MTEKTYQPFPKKNWGKDAICNYINEHSLDIDVEAVDFEDEKAKAELLDVIKSAVSELIEESQKKNSVTVDLTQKPEKLYPVTLLTKHSCFIGGTRYEFLPRVEYYVSREVRQVLIDGRIVMN